MGMERPIHYRKLDPDYDLYPRVVRGKLEYIMGKALPKQRVQIDRCLSMSFRNGFLKYSGEEDAGEVRYFTEDPQPLEFHEEALQLFLPIITYGYNLGDLAKERGLGRRQKQSLLDAGESVFTYARDGELPDMNRADLEEFIHMKLFDGIGYN